MAEINGVPVIMAAPPGYIVDFEHPHQVGATEMWCVCVVGNVLAFAMLCQRFYTNLFLVRGLHADDVTALLAWAFSVATQAQLVRLYDIQALGVHSWEMPLERFLYYSKLIYSASITYTASAAFAKVTLCLFYRRINPARTFQAGVWTLLVVCVGSSIGFFFALLVACRPIAAAWNPLAPDADCLDRPVIYMVAAAIGVVTSFLLFVVPMPTVMRLNVPTRQKLGLVGLFAVGSVTVVTSAVRLAMVHPTLDNKDPSYAISKGTIWLGVETNLLVMCCCLPTVVKFLLRLAPGQFGGNGSISSPPGTAYVLRTFGVETDKEMGGKQCAGHSDRLARGQAPRLQDHDGFRSFADEFRPEPFFQPTVTDIRGGKDLDEGGSHWLDEWGLKGGYESDEAILNTLGGSGVEVTREVEVRSNSPTSSAAAMAATVARSPPPTRDGKRSWSLSRSRTGRSRRGTNTSRRSTLTKGASNNGNGNGNGHGHRNPFTVTETPWEKKQGK